MADYLNIAGRVRTTASDGVAMEAQEVKDLNLNKSQQEVNADVQTELGDRYTKEETYSKEQLDDLITTPDVNHVSVVATNDTTAVTDVLPATGEANTICRVGNWNGTQYDPTMYALFAWNGTTYVCLAVRSFVGEVYDISVNHPDGQGNPTPYADLTAALGTGGANIPADIRRGGMSIKFIQGNAQSSDNKYVQYRYRSSLTAVADFTDVANWQGVDNEPIIDSPNLVNSNGVRKLVMRIKGVAANGTAAGATSVGDYFFHTGQNTLKRVVAVEPYTTEPVDSIIGSIYITDEDVAYSWNGTELKQVQDKIEKERAVSAENNLTILINTLINNVNKRLLKLVGMGTSGASAGVSEIGDKFYHTTQKVIKEYIGGDLSQPSSFEVVPFAANVVYMCNGDLYCWYNNEFKKSNISEIQTQIDEVKTQINPLFGIEYNFEVTASDIGHEYTRIFKDFTFKKNHIYQISVDYPANDEDRSYFQVRDGNNWIQNNLVDGTSTRRGTFTCTTDNGTILGMVIVDASVATTYHVTLMDILSDADIIPGIDGINAFLNYSYQFDTLPLYHKQAINTYVNTVATLKNAGKFVMSFLTDLHMDESFESKIGGMSGLMCFNEVGGTMVTDINILGGDYSDSKESGGTQISNTGFWEAMNNCYRLTDFCKQNQILLRGNHELTSFIDAKFYNLWAGKSLPKDAVINANDTINGTAYYGYIDYSYQKIRLLFIDTSLRTYIGDSNDKQLEWLCDVALEFSQIPDYTLVVTSHEALYPFYYGQGYETLDWGNKPAYRQLFSAFHRGNSVTINGNEIDFTTQGAIPMVYVAGHAHKDASFIDASVDMDFLTIVTRDSSTARSEVLRNRIGTVNECAFDTYVIDVNNKSIAVKRYGYGSDRTFTYN